MGKRREKTPKDKILGSINKLRNSIYELGEDGLDQDTAKNLIHQNRELNANLVYFVARNMHKRTTYERDSVPETDEVSETLTSREAEILGYAARGLTNKEIARELGTGEQTVKNQRSSAYRKIEERLGRDNHDIHITAIEAIPWYEAHRKPY